MSSEQTTNLIAPEPPELALEVQDALRTKSELPVAKMTMLGILAGAYIAFGGLFALVALGGANDLPHGVGQILAGGVFTLGLVLVVIAGAELFTGNTLMTGLAVTGSLSWGSLLRAWSIVYVANLVGSLLIAALALAGNVHTAGEGAVGRAALEIADSKAGLSWRAAFFSGILANMLVCLAVWMAYSGRTTTDKIIAVFLPIAAFVAAGLEHSVANMYLIPYGWSVKTFADPQFWEASGVSAGAFPSISLVGFLSNLVPVTLGNITGGSLIAVAYAFAYPQKKTAG